MNNFRAIKEECCEANLRLPATGLVDLTFGNVSVADLEKRVFAIKPSGVEYDALKADHMVVISFAGKVIEGDLRPSSDAATHRCLFLNFEGIRSVVHTHSRKAVAFAQAGEDLPCLGTTHADYFHGPVPVTRELTREEVEGDYEGATGAVIAETFREREIDPLAVPAALVRNHGPFSWGASAASALETALALEICAEMAAVTLQLEPSAPALPRHLLDKHYLRKHGKNAYYGQG